MSFSRVYAAQPHLLKGKIVTIEVDITPNTLFAFTMVGLPDKAVDEAKDRMASALKNSGFPSPKNQNQKVVISLSPADLKKEGSYFDLGIALSYLLSAGEINFDPEHRIFLGELALNGELRPVRGALPLAQAAKRAGYKEVFLPKENAREASLVEGIKIYGAENLKQVVDHIHIPLKNKQGEQIEPDRPKIFPHPYTKVQKINKNHSIDFSDIRGQESAKRGLEIAAAGGHNVAMSGPPGTGKTMLARVFSHILPDLENDDVLEITGIHSIVGLLEEDLLTEPPFRAPHHTASYVSMTGGGANIKPGEVTLAHKGVLFLDEFPEFEKRVIESLRQPLEDNIVSISRAKEKAVFPSNFILIAAMNPCPCGHRGDKKKMCICKPSDLDRYSRKISGPIMDRIDIWLSVGAVDFNKLSGDEKHKESTQIIKDRVQKARDIQAKRFKENKNNIKTNSEMNVKDLDTLVPLSDEVRDLLNKSAERLNLSARAYHRVIKLARTIADLAGAPDIIEAHILEALQYRPKTNF